MTTQVVLEIDDNIYHQAELLAQKSQRPVAKVLAEAIVLSKPRDPTVTWSDEPLLNQAMDREIETFHALHADLWQRYPGQYVAIYNQQVVDHDPELALLYARSQEKYPEQLVLIRQIEIDPEPVVYFRSPRLIHGDQ